MAEQEVKNEAELHIPIPTKFQQVLDDNNLRDLFRYYLKNHLASECLLFYENVEMYERIDRDEFRKRAAKGLMIKFILDPAQYRINISSDIKQKLLDTSVDDFKKDTFESAKREMFNLMEDNYFTKFVKYLRGEEKVKRLNVNTMDIYRKAKRVYANGRRKPAFKGDKRQSKSRKSAKQEDGMPPPKVKRTSSRRSDLSFESVQEIEEGLREMDAQLKDEFDYKLI